MVVVQQNLKPLLKIADMVDYLKNKNITFKYISEVDAELYLKNNNNYYNVTSYRKNFQKYTSGEKAGKFLDLDFAYLKDMAIIDMRARTILFKIILDIEHYLKMKILKEIEYINLEDGYRVVNLYLDNDYNTDKRVHGSILNKVGNDYYSKILSQYGVDENTNLIENIPIWVFLEIITFGELIKFYDFYSAEYGLTNNNEDIYILREVNRLRNAVAHNTCILNNIGEKNNNHTIDYKISNFLSVCGISKNIRDRRMSNDRIRQIIYTLYMFEEIVTSNGLKAHTYEELNDFFYERVYHHSEYYQTNDMLKSVCNFFDKIVLTLIKNSN